MAGETIWNRCQYHSYHQFLHHHYSQCRMLTPLGHWRNLSNYCDNWGHFSWGWQARQPSHFSKTKQYWSRANILTHQDSLLSDNCLISILKPSLKQFHENRNFEFFSCNFFEMGILSFFFWKFFSGILGGGFLVSGAAEGIPACTQYTTKNIHLPTKYIFIYTTFNKE